MIITINKDVEKYEESVVLGLTAKQLIYSILAISIGGGLILLIYQYVGLTVAAYIAVPIVAPIAMEGFYKNNGMGFFEVMKRKYQIKAQKRPLLYHSTEDKVLVQEIILQQESEKKKEQKKRRKREKKHGDDRR